VLSPDLRVWVGPFSSLDLVDVAGGGVAVPPFLGDPCDAAVPEIRGVCGLLFGRSCARLPSSASKSASDCCCAVAGVRDALVPEGLVAGLVAASSSPRASS